jgi:hypothetical protein
MPMTIHVDCPCGRTLRAQPDQAGTLIQCWNCKTELVVPHPDQSARLARSMFDEATELLRSPALLFILAGAILLTAALMVPRAGLLLALTLLAASVSGYGAVLGATGRRLSHREAATAPPTAVVVSALDPAPDQDEEIEQPPAWAALARGLLGVAAALAFAAPFLIRNRGHALPPEGPTPGVPWLLVLALAGWLLVPLVLATAYAHDRHGPLPPRLVLKSLGRHPLATLAAILAVPLGLIATEALLALFVWEQGQLPLMVADLFPPPRFEWENDGRHLYFNYDGSSIDTNLSAATSSVVPLYPRGLRRGFTLLGTIPPSLSVGLLEVRAIPWMYEVRPWTYLITRVVLTVLILLAIGILFTLQARWLGLIAAVDPRRRPVQPIPGTP